MIKESALVDVAAVDSGIVSSGTDVIIGAEAVF